MTTTTQVRFRAMPSRGSKPRVDREAGVIYGASAMQAGEALGHDMLIDEKTLDGIVELNAGISRGAKVRFTHPGLCGDGLGKLLGRFKNARAEGDKVIGDIEFNDTSAKTPDGDLRSYVLDLAEEDPEAFGMSVVVGVSLAWVMEDGSEIEANFCELPPEGATSRRPFMRPTELFAVDVVDEPAANRDGLFSAAFSGTTSELAADMFRQIDAWLSEHGLSVDQAKDFTERYFAARHRAEALSAHHKEDPRMGITKERLAELSKAHPDHRDIVVDMFAKDAEEGDILAAIKDAETTAQLSALNAKVEQLSADLEKARTDLAEEVKKVEDLTKERDELQAKADGLAAFGNTGDDPGGDHGGGDKNTVSRKDLNKLTPEQSAALVRGDLRVID